MTDAVDDLVLAGEFPTADEARWKAEVGRVLAKSLGTDDPEAVAARFEKTLVTTTLDGVRIEPLYTASAHEGGLPGFAPYTRGTLPLAHRRFGWDVRQLVVVAGDPEAVAKQTVDELERGVTSLLLDLTHLDTIDADTLEKALDGVYLDLVPVSLLAGDRWADAVTALEEVWRRRGVAAGDAHATLGLDPVGRYAASGGATDLAAETVAAVEIAGRWKAHDEVRPIVVDAARLHEAGAAETQELGYSLALGVHYLRALVDAGFEPGEAARQLEFRYAATPDQFLTIAKLRAARRLWERVTAVSGAAEADQRQRQHAVGSTAAASRYDIWVNLLRGTVEAFSAGVGGADAVTVLPHDHLTTTGSSPVGRRMARNAQIILIEESRLASVVDLAGGSWYVEELTDQLAQAGWAFFQELEKAGGVVASIESEWLQSKVSELAARRAKNIATRKQALTGVTEFPDIGEAPPPVAETTAATAGRFAALTAVRYAEPTEAQRGRADAAEARPEVFLATLGTPAVHTARATFAKNFFEVGGIKAVVDPGSTEPEGVAKRFAASGSRVACLCSDDATYAELAAPTAAALKAAGAERVYLAGRPKGLDDSNIDELVYVGADVLDTLTRALDLLIGAAQ